MAAPILDLGATVNCMHVGSAMPLASYSRVMINGQPIITQTSTYTISGCSLPSNAGGPCVTAQWVVAATRVLAGGTPVILQTGTAVCTPTGTGLQPLVVQSKVMAT
jgi:uncharacterized Zn-binding protein involved in type VI secretion